MITLIFISITWSYSPSVKAQQAPNAFVCDGSFFISNGLAPGASTQFNLLDFRTRPDFDLTEVGAPSAFGEYNAIGYNIQDNFVYGITPRNPNGDTRDVIRVDRNGNTTNIGSVTLTNNGSYIAGDLDESGFYYVYARGQGQQVNGQPTGLLARIEISSLSMMTTNVILNNVIGNPVLGDIAYNPVDGNLYGFNRSIQTGQGITVPDDDGVGYLTFNPNSGSDINQNNIANIQFNQIPNSLLPRRNGTEPEEQVGATFFDTAGNFFGYLNTGFLYRINVGINGNGTGQYTLVGTAESSGVNDGTSCPYVPVFEKEVSPANAAPGDIITYTYRIINGSILNLNPVVFTDTMSDGRTFIPGTVNIPGATFSNNNTTLTLNNLTVPARNVNSNTPNVTTITAQVQLPSTLASGRYLNQASLNGQVATVQTTFAVQSDFPPTVVSPLPDPTPVDVDQSLAARLRLVKRITTVIRNGQVINNVVFDRFIDDSQDDNDNAIANTGLNPVGVIGLGQDNLLQSNDVVEYTIYFLSDGGRTAQNIRLCDAIPTGTSFVENTFGGGNGILLQQGSTNTAQTNAADGDRAQFFSPLTPANNVTPPCPNANNPNGSVVVNLGDIPNTGANNRGFVRFRVTVD
ncbi:MAG: DUF11 domain-containing protein [Spirulinaceae cyanobacterium]